MVKCCCCCSFRGIHGHLFASKYPGWLLSDVVLCQKEELLLIETGIVIIIIVMVDN